MPMSPDILSDVQTRLTAEFGFKAAGDWYQQGKCPACSRRELYTRKDNPWILRCGRANKCGAEIAVKDHYRDLFEAWSTRFKPTEKEPNASADAYLLYKRGLNLLGMRGAYSQETYRDYDRNLTSATVRFALPSPDGCYWERLIDQESRFDKKAHFRKKSSYKGYCWIPPRLSWEDLARARDVWIAEGVFDAWSVNDPCPGRDDIAAVSAMSVNNYPEHFLAELRRTCGVLNLPLPRLVWAFDIGKAGAEYTRRWHDRALSEGWNSTAAQPRAEGETDKLDWNDLKLRDRLKTADIETYLWHGQVLLADDATKKAFLLWDRNRHSSFHFVFDSRTFWAHFDTAKIAEIAQSEGVTERRAAEGCSTVSEIANCAFKLLYFQKDIVSQDSHYYLSIDLSDSDGVYREKFPPAALAAAGEFKKVLIGVAPGAQYTGSTFQLDRLVSFQRRGLKTVQTLDFTGYSREHKAWVLGDYAVANGRVIPVNDEDFFDFGKVQLKLRDTTRMLKMDYDADRVDTSWLPYLWTAWRGNGLVTLTFWLMSFFAEQIRKEHLSLGYFEMSGIANTGKSTIILFLWRLCGLVNETYEGIDPSKSTMVGYIRTLAKVANLPVVFVESDRNDNAPHAKRFDWSEIKGLFNGQIGRAVGKKTQGNETYEPPFRGALIIEQNNAVVADEPVLSRIMPTVWTKAGWSQATKAAAEKIEQWPREDVSGTLLHVIRREETWMKTFLAGFAGWEKHLVSAGVRHARVRKCHAQLHAGLDALAALLPIEDAWLRETHDHIDTMARGRDKTLESDPKVVAEFWEAFDYLAAKEHDAEPDPINRHRDPAKIAVNLQAFEAKCRNAGISHPPLDELKRQLRNSKSRPFHDLTTVNGCDDRRSHCWVFMKDPAKKGD